MKTGRKNKNKGFTFVEIIIVISIFIVLLGIMVPSLNSILGFRVQRATHSIGAALDKTKTEAMSRLVGEMELKKEADGYYIRYHLDRGKVGGRTDAGNPDASKDNRVKPDQWEKIAPGNTHIKLKKTGDTEAKEMTAGESLVLTYNREDGSFRPVQTSSMSQSEIQGFLEAKESIIFKDVSPLADGRKVYCEEIIVSGGFRTRIIKLNQATGSYTITAG